MTKIFKSMPLIFAVCSMVLVAQPRGASRDVIDPLKLNVNTTRRLEQNKQAQMQKIAQSSVFHGFTFKDAFPESGVSFRHRAVDDAAKNWKPAHYDHGCGLAVADVNGDSKLDIYFVNQLGRNELWQNVGRGKFENITEAAGVGRANQIKIGR